MTTLNLKLTRAAQEELGSKKGAVVAMDPETGKILVMLSQPSYDPNNLTDARWKKLTQSSSEQTQFFIPGYSGAVSRLGLSLNCIRHWNL